MINRRKAIHCFTSVLAASSLTGCLSSEPPDEDTQADEDVQTDEDTQADEDVQTNEDTQNVPTFGLPRCSSSTYIQLIKIDGYDAVIKNTGVKQRLVEFRAYTDDSRADIKFLGSSPVTEYYVVSAGSTIGVELPGETIRVASEEDKQSSVTFPVDTLRVRSAAVTDGTRGEFESSGCINPSELEYNSNMHQLQTYEVEDTSTDWFSVSINPEIAGVPGVGYISYVVGLSESWMSRNPNKTFEFKLEVDLANGETVSHSKLIDEEYNEATISDVWDTENSISDVISKFKESTYRFYVDGTQILEESCSAENVTLGDGCFHKITTADKNS